MRRKAAELQTHIFRTAWGWCGIGVTGKGLARLIIPDGAGREELAKSLGAPETKSAYPAIRMVVDYFAGRRRAFNLPVDLAGMTAFERAVYREVAKIPYGATASYGEIARRLGRPGAARAVGMAVKKNPVPIVVPCHRVVRSDGGLGGFSSRGGVATKERLLAFERKHKAQAPR
jgi:methylated-DNA-[protein]-cysteine S-methyltransferase